MAADLEQGWPIVKRTACRVGGHVFVWWSASSSLRTDPPPGQPCDCAAIRWPHDPPEPRP